MKKIAMIIANKDFRDEEYFIPKSVFEERGFLVETFSAKIRQALGVFGSIVEIKKTMQELQVKDFSAIVFVGGGGALRDFDNPNGYKIVQEAIAANIVLSAICIAPLILAKAGVLEGKKAVVWHTSTDKSAVKQLKERGALFVEKQSIAVDNNIITARDVQSARAFAEKILTMC